MSKKLDIIGPSEVVSIAGHSDNVPAKIDTGADGTSIWVSGISVDEGGVLRFQLFDKQSELYTGDTISRTDFSVSRIRSASGHVQVRYKTHFTIGIGERRIRAVVSLADRSRNRYPVLIGRRTIAGKFLVDVARDSVLPSTGLKESTMLRNELKQDPHLFHKKYYNVDNQEVV